MTSERTNHDEVERIRLALHGALDAVESVGLSSPGRSA